MKPGTRVEAIAPPHLRGRQGVANGPTSNPNYWAVALDGFTLEVAFRLEELREIPAEVSNAV